MRACRHVQAGKPVSARVTVRIDVLEPNQARPEPGFHNTMDVCYTCSLRVVGIMVALARPLAKVKP